MMVSTPTIDVLGATSENSDNTESVGERIQQSIQDQMDDERTRTYAVYKRIGDVASAESYGFVQLQQGRRKTT
jgi:hypothetical protein